MTSRWRQPPRPSGFGTRDRSSGLHQGRSTTSACTTERPPDRRAETAHHVNVPLPVHTFLAPYTESIYALLRFMSGLLFVFHGTQKLFGFPGNRPPVELMSLRGVAGVIETFGGLMIAFGLFAAWAAFLASGLMAFAYFMRHAGDGFFPIVNRGELAVLYCFLFFYIAARGSGRFSIDAVRRGRGAARR